MQLDGRPVLLMYLDHTPVPSYADVSSDSAYPSFTRPLRTISSGMPGHSRTQGRAKILVSHPRHNGDSVPPGTDKTAVVISAVDQLANFVLAYLDAQGIALVVGAHFVRWSRHLRGWRVGCVIWEIVCRRARARAGRISQARHVYAWTPYHEDTRKYLPYHGLLARLRAVSGYHFPAPWNTMAIPRTFGCGV